MRLGNCEVPQIGSIGLYFYIVSKFDLTPLQGASLWGGQFPGLKPGLKPWAESSSPFGFGADLRAVGMTGAKQTPACYPQLSSELSLPCSLLFRIFVDKEPL
jgi:hypothetical protein